MSDLESAYSRRRGTWIWLAVLVAVAAAFVAWQRLKSNTRFEAAAFTHVNFRLQWTPQAQFAGYLVAQELGYYREEGLDVEIRAAGPDLKPQNTVAAGSDDIAVGVSNQVVASRSNGVPLKIIAQIFQDSANRYVLKKTNAINSLADLKGKKVGLWLGGDEAEFVSMLKTAGLTLADITVVPQGYTVGPFLNDEYVLSQVTTYNELNQIRAEGQSDEKLQILTPGAYNSAIVGDMLFTTEKYLAANGETVRKFLRASLKGWKYCAEHPDKAVDIVLKSDKALIRDEQVQQLREVMRLILTGASKDEGIGCMDLRYYETAERVLRESKQIDQKVEPSAVFDDRAWRTVPLADKRP